MRVEEFVIVLADTELTCKNELTQFLTQFLKKRTEKEGTGRHLPKSEFPYFTGATALYGTGRNFQECRPISNKIPSPRWAVIGSAGNCPSSFFRINTGFTGSLKFLQNRFIHYKHRKNPGFWVVLSAQMWYSDLYKLNK